MQNDSTILPRRCLHCHNPTTRKKYCSLNCWQQDKTRMRDCLGCGEPVRATPSQAKNGRKKYCSKDCQTKVMHAPLADRFWANVLKTDTCWLWQGRLSDSESHSKDKGRPLIASRVSWEIHYGAIPDGMFVCHNCPDGDNPACVNPAHLWLGTNAQNVADMVAKGRNRRGETSPGAKLTEAIVLEIRQRFATGNYTQKQLADLFKVNKITLYDVVHRKTWRHI